MSKKTILLVGSSIASLRDYLTKHNYEYTVLKDINRTKMPNKVLKRRIVCDFSSKKTILDAVDSLPVSVHGVLSIYENYIVPTAQITEHLGLPGLPLDVAEACTDKYLMRQRFDNAPVKISPAYQEIATEDQLLDFAARHQFPLILKPANLAKSLLVTKNHNIDELRANYQKAIETINEIYQKYAPNRQPKLLIEEFLEGSIHSVDAFCDADGKPHVLEQVVDYQTGYDIGYDDNFHYSRILPSALPKEQIDAIRETARIGCQALGIKNAPAHIEIILAAEGPRIVEIGARNGGYRERMHKLANGIDITGNALALAVGKQPDIVATKNESCAVLELFPKTPGTFQGIAELEKLEKLSSLVYCSIKAKPGQTIGKAADGYKMAAVVILHNPDADQFKQDLEFVNQNVHVITD